MKNKLPTHLELVQDFLLQLDACKAGWPGVIFQCSWESGEVSVDWKLAYVDPIQKNGNRDDPDSYGPVNLISVPGKIMEKNVLGVTEKHLNDNAVVGQRQHRFLS